MFPFRLSAKWLITNLMINCIGQNLILGEGLAGAMVKAAHLVILHFNLPLLGNNYDLQYIPVYQCEED